MFSFTTTVQHNTQGLANAMGEKTYGSRKCTKSTNLFTFLCISNEHVETEILPIKNSSFVKTLMKEIRDLNKWRNVLC